MSRFSFEIFLSCSTEKLRRGTLLCCVSEKLRWQKFMENGNERGEYYDFPRKISAPECRNIS